MTTHRDYDNKSSQQVRMMVEKSYQMLFDGLDDLDEFFCGTPLTRPRWAWSSETNPPSFLGPIYLVEDAKGKTSKQRVTEITKNSEMTSSKIADIRMIGRVIRLCNPEEVWKSCGIGHGTLLSRRSYNLHPKEHSEEQLLPIPSSRYKRLCTCCITFPTTLFARFLSFAYLRS